jgi:hypothetical protein
MQANMTKNLKQKKLEAMHWQDFLNLLWEDKIID